MRNVTDDWKDAHARQIDARPDARRGTTVSSTNGRGARISLTSFADAGLEISTARLPAAVSAESAPSWVLVQTTQDLRSFEAYLLGDRDRPVVALTPSADSTTPVLAPEDVRAVVGPRCGVYVIEGEQLVRRLECMLGQALAVPLGAARIWWPGLTSRSDPADHPLVQPIEGESPAEAVAEFANQFDLSRPCVREQHRLIDDARAQLELELVRERERNGLLAQQLRDAKVERHRLRS